MKKEFSPADTIPTWLVVRGVWPRREELYCADTRKTAETWLSGNYAGGRHPSNVHIEKAHIIRLGALWHRVYVTPIACRVPAHWKTPSTRSAVPCTRQHVVPTPVMTCLAVKAVVTAPQKYTWRQRIRVLFTGFPNE